MSWQAYVDTNLVGSGKIKSAAILGRQGGVWATSSGFNLTPEEQATLLAAHDNTAQTQASGIRLAGVKYLTISVDERSINGKKGVDGCVIVRTKQAILIGTYTTPSQQSEAAVVVEGLADYLIGVGY
ncbi:hypothetical protein PHLGIDRAFT_10763 [Phlebiopsis gigantea 11061_1 CR5-6]|uniref:Profilin n=1 Tax=Phlebiopsis gigantea (strain 11061_1 CR5-6) TaxID=745531 RepID=A0A0C3S5K5_PHLG1|nr:hypothetical protein PHLGIDRAFT_10763 [Phlebiopsis gigantea 11061_1 CR5-6]